MREICKSFLFFLLKLYKQKCKTAHKKCKLNGLKSGIMFAISRFYFLMLIQRGLVEQHGEYGFNLVL